jgi:hypothetical protein
MRAEMLSADSICPRLKRAQPRDGVRDAKGAHASAPLRNIAIAVHWLASIPPSRDLSVKQLSSRRLRCITPGNDIGVFNPQQPSSCYCRGPSVLRPGASRISGIAQSEGRHFERLYPAGLNTECIRDQMRGQARADDPCDSCARDRHSGADFESAGAFVPGYPGKFPHRLFASALCS